jgi:hypothetical protein
MRNHFRISDYVTSCIFENDLFLTIEKKNLRSARLKEYQLQGGGFKSFEQNKGRDIFVLEDLKSIGPMSRIRAIRTEGESVTIVVCNTSEEIGLVSGQLTKTK